MGQLQVACDWTKGVKSCQVDSFVFIYGWNMDSILMMVLNLIYYKKPFGDMTFLILTPS